MINTCVCAKFAMTKEQNKSRLCSWSSSATVGPFYNLHQFIPVLQGLKKAHRTLTRGKEDKSHQTSWTCFWWKPTVKLDDIVFSVEAECVAGCVWGSAQQSAPQQDDLMKLLSELMVRYWPSLTSSRWTSTWPWKRTSLASQRSPDSNKKTILTSL